MSIRDWLCLILYHVGARRLVCRIDGHDWELVTFYHERCMRCGLEK